MSIASPDLREAVFKNTVATLLCLLQETNQHTRYSMCEQLRRELGNTEETAFIIDSGTYGWLCVKDGFFRSGLRN